MSVKDLPALTGADKRELRDAADLLNALADKKGFTGEETAQSLQRIEDTVNRIARDLFWRAR
jgi:hypothetical protein